MKLLKKIDPWLYTIPIFIIVCIIYYIVLHLRIKYFGLFLSYLIPLLVTAGSIITFIIGCIYAYRNRPFFNIARIIGFLLLILLYFNGRFYGKYPSYYDDKPSEVKFQVPTDVELTVGWGGKNVKENYHAVASDQCWAYDLLIAKNGKTYSGSGENLTDYYCYDVPLKAPASGVIIKAFDKDPDMPIGELGGGTEAYGNYIILKVAKGQYLYMCHFKPKSILVKKGDSVTKGQPIGRIGNSGNTSEPHLHMHLQDSADLGEGIPMYFYNVDVNGVYKEKSIPKGGVDKDDYCIGDRIKNKSI